MLKKNRVQVILSISVISLLAFSFKSYAGDTLYFVGNISVSKKISYSYSLRFTINQNQTITGYSLTDARGLNETKTKIIGKYDSVAHTISIEEKNILRSKVDMQKNDICFVKAVLAIKTNKYVETLSGKFTGNTPGKLAPCANGEIKVINTNRAKVILEEIAKKEAEKNDIKEEKENGNALITIADEKAKYLPFTGKYIKFTIWDNGQVDGDRISIKLNGKYILEDYTLDTKTKVIEEISSDKAIDTIQIIALNEGTLPPNTATIRIESKSEQYPIEIQANPNEIRTIYLRKNK